MNKKQFLKVITEVVRREVKKEVKKIFIREQSSPQMSLTDQAGRKSKDIKYTKNKSLNDVLNETVGLAKNEKSDFATVGGGTFDTARMTELLGYGKTDEMKRDMVAVDTIKKAGRSLEQVPDHVTNALTRDYSGLMKAIEQKKGSK